jgi:hypothetical protein
VGVVPRPLLVSGWCQAWAAAGRITILPDLNHGDSPRRPREPGERVFLDRHFLHQMLYYYMFCLLQLRVQDQA